MKKSLIYLAILSNTLLLTACGGGSETQPTENRAVLGVSQNSTIMKENLLYSMKKGETIVPITSEPKVAIETNLVTGQTTAKLLSGSAKIVVLN
jgi:hypothetical protein